MKKYFVLFLILVSVSLILCVNVFASSEETEISWNFDEIDGFLDGCEIEGLTLTGSVARTTSSQSVRGVHYHNAISFNMDGNNIYNAVKFYLDGTYTVYVVADSIHDRGCTLFVDGYGPMWVTKDVNVYKFDNCGGDVGIYIEPTGSVDIETNVRIFAIYAVPDPVGKYTPLPAGEGRYWRFDDFSFTGIEGSTFTSDYTEDGLSILADSDNPVYINTSQVDSTAGIRYKKSIYLYGAGTETARSIEFFAEPNSDIYITAGASQSGRTLYVTNKYGEEFYYDGVSQDINVTNSVVCYKATYTGDGEMLQLRSAGSGIKIYDIRIVGHETPNTSVIENKSWNFSTNPAFSVHLISDEEETDGLKIYGAYSSAAKISSVNEGGYTKAVDLVECPNSINAKIAFDISDSTGSDKYRTQKTIAITAKNNDSTGEETGKVYIIDKYNRLINSFTITKSIETYLIPYDGYNQTLYLYSKNQPIRIYEISITDIGSYFGEVTKTLSVTKGSTYTYFCNVYNLPSTTDYIYVIAYNQNALKIKNVGYGYPASTSNNIGIDDNIKILSNNNGFLEFTVDSEYTNWSGVLTTIEFEALSTGNTTIGFDFYEKGA